MSLISLVLTLIVVGVLLWLVNTYIPMDGKIKKILNIVVVICVVIWLLYAFGILGRPATPLAQQQRHFPFVQQSGIRGALLHKREVPLLSRYEATSLFRVAVTPWMIAIPIRHSTPTPIHLGGSASRWAPIAKPTMSTM